MVLAAAARGGEHAPRELPANAVQPPGASFEREITWQQKAMLCRDTLRSTVAEVARHPARSAVFGTSRLAERAGVSRITVRAAETGALTVAVGTIFELATVVGVDLFGGSPDQLPDRLPRL